MIELKQFPFANKNDFTKALLLLCSEKTSINCSRLREFQMTNNHVFFLNCFKDFKVEIIGISDNIFHETLEHLTGGLLKNSYQAISMMLGK